MLLCLLLEFAAGVMFAPNLGGRGTLLPTLLLFNVSGIGVSLSFQQDFHQQVATGADVDTFSIVSAEVLPRPSLAVVGGRRETEARAARPPVGRPGTRADAR